MKLHHREKIVQKAELKLMADITELYEMGLTDAEMLRVVCSELSSFIGRYAKYEIRAERHPNDPDCPGGIEGDEETSSVEVIIAKDSEWVEPTLGTEEGD